MASVSDRAGGVEIAVEARDMILAVLVKMGFPYDAAREALTSMAHAGDFNELLNIVLAMPVQDDDSVDALITQLMLLDSDARTGPTPKGEIRAAARVEQSSRAHEQLRRDELLAQLAEAFPIDDALKALQETKYADYSQAAQYLLTQASYRNDAMQRLQEEEDEWVLKGNTTYPPMGAYAEARTEPTQTFESVELPERSNSAGGSRVSRSHTPALDFMGALPPPALSFKRVSTPSTDDPIKFPRSPSPFRMGSRTASRAYSDEHELELLEGGGSRDDGGARDESEPVSRPSSRLSRVEERDIGDLTEDTDDASALEHEGDSDPLSPPAQRPRGLPVLQVHDSDEDDPIDPLSGPPAQRPRGLPVLQVHDSDEDDPIDPLSGPPAQRPHGLPVLQVNEEDELDDQTVDGPPPPTHGHPGMVDEREHVRDTAALTDGLVDGVPSVRLAEGGAVPEGAQEGEVSEGQAAGMDKRGAMGPHGLPVLRVDTSDEEEHDLPRARKVMVSVTPFAAPEEGPEDQDQGKRPLSLPPLVLDSPVGGDAHVGNNELDPDNTRGLRSSASLLLRNQGGFYDEDSGIHVYPYGMTLYDASGDFSESVVSAHISPELLNKCERRSGVVYLCGVAFNELEQLGVIGCGAQGSVTKVLHRPTDRYLACKSLPLNNDSKHRKVVARELRNLYHTRSDHVVKFHGAFFSEGNVQICMEYMDAGSLRDLYYMCGAVPEDAIAMIAHAVVDAIACLAARGVLHRDVKPENILLSLTGAVKLGDLGMSIISLHSSSRAHVGTRRYFSPERVVIGDNRDRKPSVLHDVWSIGVTLTEMGLGRYPYPVMEDAVPRTTGARVRNPSEFQMHKYLVEDPIPRLPSDHFSVVCLDFLSKTLMKDPARRPDPAYLLKHPFIKRQNKQKYAFDMSSFLRGVFTEKAAALDADVAAHPYRYIERYPGEIGTPMATQDAPILFPSFAKQQPAVQPDPRPRTSAGSRAHIWVFDDAESSSETEMGAIERTRRMRRTTSMRAVSSEGLQGMIDFSAARAKEEAQELTSTKEKLPRTSRKRSEKKRTHRRSRSHQFESKSMASMMDTKSRRERSGRRTVSPRLPDLRTATRAEHRSRDAAREDQGEGMPRMRREERMTQTQQVGISRRLSMGEPARKSGRDTQSPASLRRRPAALNTSNMGGTFWGGGVSSAPAAGGRSFGSPTEVCPPPLSGQRREQVYSHVGDDDGHMEQVVEIKTISKRRERPRDPGRTPSLPHLKDAVRAAGFGRRLSLGQLEAQSHAKRLVDSPSNGRLNQSQPLMGERPLPGLAVAGRSVAKRNGLAGSTRGQLHTVRAASSSPEPLRVAGMGLGRTSKEGRTSRQRS